jgi:hypothetical protein
MNQLIDPAKSGLAVGALLGVCNLLWSILVALGLAQGLINLILWAHMVNIPTAVNTFDISTAAALVVITSIFGYAFGYLFAIVWNWMHRNVATLKPDVADVI